MAAADRVCISALLFAAAAIALDPPISFEDIAPSAGLAIPNISGGKTRKSYILETTGNGAAIFDYDGDGVEDILIANGTTLEGPGKGPPRTVQLYHNNG